MNTSKSKIDQLFSEKLECFEAKPRAQAWDKLENKINNNNKKRAIGWYRIAIAASVALLAFVGVLSYFNNSEPIKSQSKLATNTTKRESITAEKDIIKKQEYANTEIITVDTKIENIATQTKKINAKKFFESNQTKQESMPSLIVENKSIEVVKPTIETTNSQQFVEVLAESTPLKVETEKELSQQKEEDLTIIFTVANFEKPTMNEVISNESIAKEKKNKYLPRLFKQLINAKNGDKVDWNEVGFKPAKLLARAENKIKLTKNEINDSYQTTKNKTVF